MKPIFKSILAVLAIGLMIAFTLTLTSNDAVAANDEVTVTNYANLVPASSNACCPPGWTIYWVCCGDPALKWDKNGDSYVCFKGVWLGGDTPQGKGNDPLFDQSNVKDNNNPCD